MTSTMRVISSRGMHGCERAQVAFSSQASSTVVNGEQSQIGRPDLLSKITLGRLSFALSNGANPPDARIAQYAALPLRRRSVAVPANGNCRPSGQSSLARHKPGVMRCSGRVFHKLTSILPSCRRSYRRRGAIINGRTRRDCAGNH